MELLINQIDKDTADADNDLLYISEGGASIANLYGRTAPPLIVPLSGGGTLNFNYKPDSVDLISRVRFVIQFSGKYNYAVCRNVSHGSD